MADVVYFIEHGNLIKIGYSSNLASRMRHIPGRLLYFEPGGLTEEAGYHNRFAGLREYGEWFRSEPSLMGYIASLGPCPPVPPAAAPRETELPDTPYARRCRAAAQDLAASRSELIEMVREARAAGLSLRAIGAAAEMSHTHIANLLASDG